MLILGFGQSVSIEEDRGVCEDVGILQDVLPLGKKAYWHIRFAGQLANTCTNQQRDIVTGIAVVQMTCLQIKHAHEKGDEHVRFIALNNDIVQVLHDDIGHGLMSRYRTEYRPGNRHEERGRHTLTAHVTDAEEEFVVAEEEIKQVAAHRFGRRQRGIDLHIVTVSLCGELLG